MFERLRGGAMAKRRARRVDFGNIDARTDRATRGMVELDRAANTHRSVIPELAYPVEKIGPRIADDTRPLRADHVVDLAESIDALGLLEPVVIDAKDRLLAGRHRVAACQLLATPEERRGERLAELVGEADAELVERLETLGSTKALLVHRIDFDSAKDVERALAIETAENTQRRDYTRAEVRKIYDRLIEAGYTDRPGKPRRGEQAVKPAIAVVIGRSLRTVKRMLNRTEPASPETEQLNRAILQLGTGLRRVLRVHGRVPEDLDPRIPALIALLNSDPFQTHLEEACGAVRERSGSPG